MARPTKEALETKLRSKQPMRTAEVMTLLRQFGFEERRSNSGTSHIFIWNPDYPEIETGIVVAGTKKRDSQYNAIKMCLRVLEIDAVHEADQDHKAQPDIEVIGAFAKVTEENLNPPDDIEIIQGRKDPSKTFLRHKEYPQIATEILGDNDDGIAEKCTYLRDRALRLEEALNYAMAECDFEMERYSNGMIVLMHPCHDITTALYPFTPRLQNWTSISAVEELSLKAMEKKDEYEENLAPYKNYYDLTERPATDSARVFEKRNTFDMSITETIHLPVTKNGYFSPIDGIRLIQNCENVNWRNFHKVIKRKHGFVLEKQDDGTTKATHPLHDVTFEIDSSDLMAPLDDLLDSYMDLTEEEKEEQQQQIEAVFKAYGDRATIIRNAVEQHDAITTPWVKESAELVPKITTMRPTTKFVAGEIGLFRFIVGNETHDLPVLFRIGTNKNFEATKQAITPPDSLAVLREAKKRYEMQLAQAEPTFSMNAPKGKPRQLGDISVLFDVPAPQASPLPPFAAQNTKQPKNTKK